MPGRLGVPSRPGASIGRRLVALAQAATFTCDERAAARLVGNRAYLAIARKLLERGFLMLRELGEEALQAV